MRLTSATYNAPSRNATPLGMLSPEASVRTAGKSLPGVPLTAYTLPLRVPTKSVPRWPQASERAPGTLSVYTSSLKPGGKRTLRSTWSVASLAQAASGVHRVNARIDTNLLTLIGRLLATAIAHRLLGNVC